MLKKTEEIWILTPGRGGRPHNPEPMRRFLPDYTRTLPEDNPYIKKHFAGWLNKYKENWGLLI